MSEILIKSLVIHTHIGVPEAERAEAQRLLVDAIIEPLTDFPDLDDDITRTVDYDAASRRIQALAAEHPRRLIETLAHEIALLLVTEFPARQATVEIRKFILPHTDYVAVRHTLRRPPETP